MKIYKSALIGCSRMGAFIDNEIPKKRQQARTGPKGRQWFERGAYSHAAGYEACNRTKMVACSDLREEVMEQVGLRYDVPKNKQYTDYKEMIDQNQPDIISVATQPEQRAEIVIYAAEHGVKAIYAEKAMAASLSEADAMVEAVERNGVYFNMGTNRRWDPGFDAMKGVIDEGRIGKLKTLVIHQTNTLFNGASHSFDLLLRLNSDCPVSWVQAHLPNGGDAIAGDLLKEDPVGHGIINFKNDVTAYALNSGRGMEVEAVGEHGVVSALENGSEWQLRELGERGQQDRTDLTKEYFPDFKHSSSTVCLIEDLVNSLDTGTPSRCGVRLARANTELIFAFVESHVRDGAQIHLPLESSKYRLHRNTPPRQPRYAL